MPRSTPTAPPFGTCVTGLSSRSTVNAAYQRPARRETVMRSTRAPPTRAVTSSMQCTRPIRGSFSAFGSPWMRPNTPVVYAKRGVARSFALNFGNPTFRPFRAPRRLFDQFSKPFAKASRPLLYASLEFSDHQITPFSPTANVSLLAFHQRRSPYSDHSGFAPASMSAFTWAKPALNANLAAPA